MRTENVSARGLRYATVVATSALAVMLLGSFVSTTHTAPANAVVYVNPDSKTYLSPACVGDERELLPMTTKDKARATGLKPDSACVERGGFVDHRRSLTGRLLEAVGLLPRQVTRWDDAGNWRW